MSTDNVGTGEGGSVLVGVRMGVGICVDVWVGGVVVKGGIVVRVLVEMLVFDGVE